MIPRSKRTILVLICFYALVAVLAFSKTTKQQIKPSLANRRVSNTDKHQEKSLRLILITVIGESYVGVMYQKSAQLSRNEEKYVLVYSCWSWRTAKTCGCKRLRGEVKSAVAEKFFQDIESLQDGGEDALCCDHPYTRVEITYQDGNKKKLTIGGDLLADYDKKRAAERTKILGLNCK